MQADPERVEDICEQLASQGSLIVDAGVAEWPDGSVSGRYRFRHALYRWVLYDGVAAARRVRLHRAVGRREEAGFGSRAADHAAELAMHFSRGHAHPRALHFHELAAAAALERHAGHEAAAHCAAALEALEHVPERSDRASRELALVVARATLLMAIQGYAAPATEQAFARAHALCGALPPGPQLYAVLRGLLSYHQVRATSARRGRSVICCYAMPASVRRTAAARAGALWAGHDAVSPRRAGGRAHAPRDGAARL
jgi:predicted ATPase